MSPNDGDNWTVKDMKQLKSLVDKGWEYSRIAKKLGRTIKAVISRLHIIYTAELYYEGRPEDTIKTYFS